MQLVGDADGGVKEVPAPPARRFDGTGGAALVQKPPLKPGRALTPTETQRVLASVAAVPPQQLVWVMFTLEDVPIDWAAFGKLSDADRPAAIGARLNAIHAKQAPFNAWLKSVGAEPPTSYFLVNHLRVHMPAGSVAAALMRPGVQGVVTDDAPAFPASAETGIEVQSHIRTPAFYSAGITGHAGGRATGRRIRLGFAEATNSNYLNVPYTGHPSLKRGHGRSGTRLRTNLYCPGSNGVTCAPQTASTTNVYTHGQLVIGAAAGSIEDGQDPNFSGSFTPSQIQRSGNLRDAYLYYYLVPNSAGLKAAVDRAVQDGVDILNMSLTIGFDDCDANRDPSGLNASIRAAVNAGVVIVAATGDTPSQAGECTLGYPATRPDVLSSTLLDPSKGDPDTTVPYSEQPWATGAPIGGMTIQLLGGGVTTISRVDLAGPGCFLYLPKGPNSYLGPGDPSQSPFYSGTCASSISTPIASAMIGAIKGGFAQSGHPISSARLMMAHALLMGDGYNPDLYGYGGLTQQGVSSKTGVGRIRGHWPSTADLSTPYSWGWRNEIVYQGQTTAWPVVLSQANSYYVTQWKWAVFMTPTTYTDVPDVDFSVWNTCAPGGPVQLYADYGYDIRGRFRLDSTSIAGSCLEMRAYGYNVPPEGVSVYSADYYHSGNPNDH